VTLVVEQSSFPAHRIVLAAHSEYFYRMFTCGMAESRNQDVKIQGIDPEVMQEVLAYIYSGKVETSDVDILKGMYLAANMLQMSDLEHITVVKLGKACTMANCLDLYFFVQTFCDSHDRAGLHKKVRRTLAEVLADRWGDMIGQTNSNTVSDRYRQLFQDGIVPTSMNIRSRPESMDRLQEDFLELDLESLCEVFRLKGQQEEVSDFSFSFGQTDLCEGLIAWINHDREERQQYVHRLREYVCLHQVSGNTKKKYCKLMHEITDREYTFNLRELSVERGGDSFVLTFGQLDQDCVGAWCPKRRIPGLLLIHAWNPNDMNTLTSDHVKCHFVRPQTGVTVGEPRVEILGPDTLYGVRDAGELSVGETHWLTSNNPIVLPNGSAMMLSLDCGVVCGQVYDGENVTARCLHHSSQFPEFCVSNIRDASVDLKSASVCATETGHVYIVGRRVEVSTQGGGEEGLQPLIDEAGNTISSQEACDTFKFVEHPDTGLAVSNANSACLKGNLYVFGGTVVTEGPNYGYIWCTFDLQEFETRYTQSYKAGHSVWKTKLTSIESEPETSGRLKIFDLATESWMTYPDEMPFRISGGATTWHLDKLYLIGGYTVEYDCELKSFYQLPSNMVWIFDPASGRWSPGPPLPPTSLETENRAVTYRGYCLGHCGSYAGVIYYSGGATLAVNNLYKSSNPDILNKYEYVSFSGTLRLDPSTQSWSPAFQVKTGRKHDYTLYGALPISINLRRIKAKNGRLVSCQVATEETLDVFVAT